MKTRFSTAGLALCMALLGLIGCEEGPVTNGVGDGSGAGPGPSLGDCLVFDNALSPPAWLHGEWRAAGLDPQLDLAYLWTFTADNAIVAPRAAGGLNFKELRYAGLRNERSSGGLYSFEQCQPATAQTAKKVVTHRFEKTATGARYKLDQDPPLPVSPSWVEMVKVSGGGPGPGPAVDTPASELTGSIGFAGGTVRSGRPPAATNNPGDPRLSGAPSTPSTVTPGMQGTMQIDFADVPANASFDVNIRFDDADGYISVPQVNGGSTSGTVDLPFSLPEAVCENLEDVKHQIMCYESVSIGGVRVSAEQARQLVLDCGPPEEPTGSGFVPVPAAPQCLQIESGERSDTWTNVCTEEITVFYCYSDNTGGVGQLCGDNESESQPYYTHTAWTFGAPGSTTTTGHWGSAYDYAVCQGEINPYIEGEFISDERGYYSCFKWVGS